MYMYMIKGFSKVSVFGLSFFLCKWNIGTCTCIIDAMGGARNMGALLSSHDMIG